MCRKCPPIPQETDFRKRVTREAAALIKRGSRVCEGDSGGEAKRGSEGGLVAAGGGEAFQEGG